MRESTEEVARQCLTRLERTVRRWQCIGMSLCVVVGVGFLIRAATRKDLTTAEEVLARHFMLVGRTPTAQATLTIGKDGRPSLGLLDAQEPSQVVLTLQPNGSPVMRLLDAQGQVIWSAP